jgi:hypothetical protein
MKTQTNRPTKVKHTDEKNDSKKRSLQKKTICEISQETDEKTNN